MRIPNGPLPAVWIRLRVSLQHSTPDEPHSPGRHEALLEVRRTWQEARRTPLFLSEPAVHLRELHCLFPGVAVLRPWLLLLGSVGNGHLTVNVTSANTKPSISSKIGTGTSTTSASCGHTPTTSCSLRIPPPRRTAGSGSSSSGKP